MGHALCAGRLDLGWGNCAMQLVTARNEFWGALWAALETPGVEVVVRQSVNKDKPTNQQTDCVSVGVYCVMLVCQSRHEGMAEGWGWSEGWAHHSGRARVRLAAEDVFAGGLSRSRTSGRATSAAAASGSRSGDRVAPLPAAGMENWVSEAFDPLKGGSAARLAGVSANSVAETSEPPMKAAVTLPSAFLVAQAYSRNSRMASLPPASSTRIVEPSRHFMLIFPSLSLKKPTLFVTASS